MKALRHTNHHPLPLLTYTSRSIHLIKVATIMADYTQADPFTTTRRDFTANLLSTPTPKSATADYAKVQDGLKGLLTPLINHTAMELNIDQTFMTPAASKNKVYFMWDFVGRSLGILYMLDPSDPKGEAWKDVVGRCVFTEQLMENNGMVRRFLPLCATREVLLTSIGRSWIV
jgi:hypothetical protein